MKMGTRAHKAWLWWSEVWWLPDWPWKVYCALFGHTPTDDQCMIPAHRYCSICFQLTPNAEIKI